jgi:hypothetical protein
MMNKVPHSTKPSPAKTRITDPEKYDNKSRTAPEKIKAMASFAYILNRLNI